MKHKRKNFTKQKPVMTAAKALLIILTAVYPFFMTIMTGVGILSKSENYGKTISEYAVALILSGSALTGAAILCLFRKSLPNLLSVSIAVPGFALCMAALSRLAGHAEKAGWMGHGAYALMPVADMYRQRIFPVILPFLLTCIIAAVQFFSYSAGEERREKRRRKENEKNAPAPKIIDS